MEINTQKAKSIIRLVLPPLFLKAYQIVVKKKQLPLNTFEGVYRKIAEIENVTDYDNQESLNNIYTQTIEKFKDSQHEKLLPKSMPRSQICNLLPMLVATFMEKQISILDYGGGYGYFLHRLS